MIHTFADYKGDFQKTCQVCVIGSGPGGAVVAKELAEKGHEVVLLEEGGHFTRADWNGLPLPGLMNLYRDGGSTGTVGNAGISVTLGRCIGGSSTINSATCFRTPEPILANWRRDLGLAHLTPAALEPVFERVESILNVTELPWEVLGKNARVVKRGCDKLGLDCRPLKHNVRDCRGCGPCQFGCQEGAKQSADVTYIPRAEQHGAEIFADCRAEKLIINHGRVHGVIAAALDPRTGRPAYRVVITARLVVVAGGAMLTPAFLRRQGLKNRHIGRNLQIHPGTRVVALMDEIVEGWKGVSQGAYVDDFSGQGIMLEGIFVHPSLLLPALPGVGHEHKQMAQNYNRLAAFGVMAHDESSGRVYNIPGRRRSNRPLNTYSLTPGDIEKLKTGVAHTAAIFFAAGAVRVFTGISKMPVLESMEEVEKLRRLRLKPIQVEMLAFHPLGSCRMAAHPTLGAVSPDGETYDVRNLFVADGSLVPTSLGVNPQITIMALATQVAESIDQRLALVKEQGSIR
ncbi:MAG: GMC family oxidoreductase N-terminal domain-containing protein [Desulfosudaceae bacterium]